MFSLEIPPNEHHDDLKGNATGGVYIFAKWKEVSPQAKAVYFGMAQWP